MVDATARFERNDSASQGGSPRAMPEAQVARTFSVSNGNDLGTYRNLCGNALVAPAQSAEWVSRWIAEMRPDTVIIELNMGSRPVFALALEVEQRGPFRIARFMGGRHANGNFPATDHVWAGSVTADDFQPLFDALGKARPDIDLIVLERLSFDLDGAANPLAKLTHSASPNLALAVDLDGGFDSVLDRSSARRRRKKHRAQIRKFEAIGPYRRVEAKSQAETHALLEAFFAMKASRFSKMGIANVFGDAQVQRFFHALFSNALAQTPPRFVLHGLEIAGKLRAITGSSVSGKRLICEFGAIEDGELSHTSPGDFLFFDNIQEACEQGFDVYDFSVGDEPFKRLWCDIEIRQFDVLVPLTMKGRMLALGLHQGSRLKTFVKNNPTIWKLTKFLRRKTAGQKSPTAEDDR